MRYEETKSVGDYYQTAEYEGTPEEIAKLKKLNGEKERKKEKFSGSFGIKVPDVDISDPDIKIPETIMPHKKKGFFREG